MDSLLGIFSIFFLGVVLSIILVLVEMLMRYINEKWFYITNSFLKGPFLNPGVQLKTTEKMLGTNFSQSFIVNFNLDQLVVF